MSQERIVDKGEVISARRVTSPIDLGLYLVAKLAGDEVAHRIRKQMDYMQTILISTANG